MADYNRDETLRMERNPHPKEWPKSVKIGEEKYETLEIDISDNLFIY